jgi:hypothetical protein
LQFLDVALVLGADKSSNNCVNCLGNIHGRVRCLLAVIREREHTGWSAGTSTNILFYLFGCASAKNGDTPV